MLPFGRSALLIFQMTSVWWYPFQVQVRPMGVSVAEDKVHWSGFRLPIATNL
jgi:hypothetical protein